MWQILDIKRKVGNNRNPHWLVKLDKSDKTETAVTA